MKLASWRKASEIKRGTDFESADVMISNIFMQGVDLNGDHCDPNDSNTWRLVPKEVCDGQFWDNTSNHKTRPANIATW